MLNPWIKLPEQPPYLLPEDQPLVARHNKQVEAIYQFHPEVLPEPYLGRVDAPIVLLNANPGFSMETAPFFGQPHVQRFARCNLLHEKLEYPFFLLDPALDATQSGARWWSEKLKPLLQKVSRKQVANTICCIEFLPYRSNKFKPTKDRLYSQNYSFHLVRQAMQRNAVLIIMRSAKHWYRAIPELQQYPQLFELLNPQNVVVSSGNCPNGFPLIERLLLNAE